MADIKLNLGSGPIATDGWICIDRSPSLALDKMPVVKRALHRSGIINDAQATSWDRRVVRGDIRRLRFEDDSVAAIYTSHTLEHLYLDDVERVLRESFRVLIPNRVIRIALPDSLVLAENFVAGVLADNVEACLAYNASLLAFPARRPKGMEIARRVVGGHIHRWQPSAPHVVSMLKTAGFAAVERRDFQTGELPDLGAIETRPESFFVEARKVHAINS